jgi:hypothetical protein
MPRAPHVSLISVVHAGSKGRNDTSGARSRSRIVMRTVRSCGARPATSCKNSCTSQRLVAAARPWSATAAAKSSDGSTPNLDPPCA